MKIRYNLSMKKILKNESSVIFKDEFLDFETGALLSPVETKNYTILQVADSFYGGRFCIEKHLQHCDLELTFPLGNGLFCSKDEKWQKLNKYDVYLSFKGDTHSLKSNTGCRFQTLAINVKDDSKELFYAIARQFDKRKHYSLQELAGLFTAIISEFISENPSFSNMYIDSLITSVLVRLLRGKNYTENADIMSTQETLPSIITYLDSHFLDIYSLEELSMQFGYNYGHICKTFKKNYGITPREYLLSKKMDYAVKLLKDGKNVNFISDELRYSTPYNFSRAFKTHFGLSPVNYFSKHK